MVALEVELAKSRVQKGKVIDMSTGWQGLKHGEPPVCSFLCGRHTSKHLKVYHVPSASQPPRSN